MTTPFNLRLHQLRALVAVVEHGSIRAAARASNLSQAAMALVRSSDLVSIFPRPLLEQPESRGVCATDVPGLLPEDVHLVQMSRADVPLTRAADWFARCLRDACTAIPAARPPSGAQTGTVPASLQGRIR